MTVSATQPPKLSELTALWAFAEPAISRAAQQASALDTAKFPKIRLGIVLNGDNWSFFLEIGRTASPSCPSLTTDVLDGKHFAGGSSF